MKYTLGTFVRKSDTELELPILDDLAVVCDVITVTDPSQIAGTIVELVSEYDIEPAHMRDLVRNLPEKFAPDMTSAFKGVAIFYDAMNDEFIAQTKDGDSGKAVAGHGPRAADALADLVRSHGFKSKLHDGGPMTIEKWLQDFQYGFDRISEEQLKADMDLMFEPDAGAW